MLKESDLDDFARLVRRVECETTPGPSAYPDTVLRAAEKSAHLLRSKEYARLYRSLKIASVAGDVPESSHQVLKVILRNLAPEERCYLPLSHDKEWLSAIRWAARQEDPSTADSLHPMARQIHVGSACRRLRERGYRVQIGALGPSLDDETRTAIARRVDSLIARIGGIAAARKICESISAKDNIHDGMWLLGNKTSIYEHPSDPALPIGWLLAIALRHIHRQPSTGDPADTWKSAMELTIDFATSMDCQRYNSFDGLNPDASDFLQLLEESLVWRELFTLAHAPKGAVNSKYLDPFGTHPCNHDQFVFFETNGDHVLVLPRALTAAAACVAIFTSVRKMAEGANAGNIVGATIEKTVAIACRAHTDCVYEGIVYQEGKAKLEIDIAVRDGQQLVVFEAKAKPLTSKARTGDMMAFIFDYTNSFLALLRQLVRHERNIKHGLTPLAQPEDSIDALRVTKVAVSPLCYGPSSDHVMAGSLFRSIFQSRLNSVTGNAEHVEILDEFNKKLEQITRDLKHVAPRRNGEIDLFAYFIDLFWLDLGQLLYALHRGRSITDGLSALKHLTFRTQDFWTEAAFADRKELTKEKWHPISDGAPTC